MHQIKREARGDLIAGTRPARDALVDGKGRAGRIDTPGIVCRIRYDHGVGDGAWLCTWEANAGLPRRHHILGGIIDTRATRSHVDAMLQPYLGPQHQSGLDEAKRQQ